MRDFIIRWGLFLTPCAAVSFAAPPSAWAYCTGLLGPNSTVDELEANCDDADGTVDDFYTYPNFAGSSEIPVWLDDSIVGRLQTSSGDLWGRTEIAWEVRWVLQMINNYSGADLPRMYFAGWSTACSRVDEGGPSNPDPDCLIPNAINISWWAGEDDCEVEIGRAEPCNDPTKGRLVTLGADCAEFDFYHTSRIDAKSTGVATLDAVIGHEIIHVLGLAHPDDQPAGIFGPTGCGEPFCTEDDDPDDWPCAKMNRTIPAMESQELYLDDALGLRDIYGSFNVTQSTMKESSNGTDWPGVWSTPASDMMPLFQLSSATSGTDMLLAHRQGATQEVQTMLWDWFGTSWSSFGGSTWQTIGHVGAGWDPASDVGYSFQQEAEQQDAGIDKSFSIFERDGGFPTDTEWTTTSRRHGAMGTFDPATDARLMAYRADDGVIQVVIQKPSGGLVGPFGITDSSGELVFAADTPSMACGEATSSYPKNCILMWAHSSEEGTGDTLHTLRWMHLAVSVVVFFGSETWGLSTGPLMSQGAVLQETPLVTFKGPVSGSDAWVVSLTQVERVWTGIKSSDPQASWGSWNAHTDYVGLGQVANALGSVNDDVELLMLR